LLFAALEDAEKLLAKVRRMRMYDDSKSNIVSKPRRNDTSSLIRSARSHGP
jgi:hypothetical protein